MAQAAAFVLQSERCVSCERSKELIDYLETLRLPEEPVKPQNIVDEKMDDNDVASTDRLNDPSKYSAQVPFLIYDENKETIISRTAKGINEGELNPYEVNWMEVTLYESMFVKPLLESIHSAYLMDVAQAIDDEEARHACEDGQYTQVASNSYGTGQGSSKFHSHTIDNWNDDINSVSAVTIAEGILDKRNKAEEYRKKMSEKKDNQNSELKKHIIEIIDEPESHLHISMRESLDHGLDNDNNALRITNAQLNSENEIQLKKISQLTKELQMMSDTKAIQTDIVIADDRKIDVIKILHSMCRTKLFKKKDNSKINIQELMEAFGRLLNNDFSNYSSNLSVSKTKTKPETYLAIFDELKESEKEYYNKS